MVLSRVVSYFFEKGRNIEDGEGGNDCGDQQRQPDRRSRSDGHHGGYADDLFAGTPVYKPSGFPIARVTLGFQVTAQF